MTEHQHVCVECMATLASVERLRTELLAHQYEDERGHDVVAVDALLMALTDVEENG